MGNSFCVDVRFSQTWGKAGFNNPKNVELHHKGTESTEGFCVPFVSLWLKFQVIKFPSLSNLGGEGVAAQ